MRIEHIALNIADPIKAADWYCQNLDMQIVRQSDEPPFLRFIADQAGRGMLEIYANPAAEVPDYQAMSPFILHIAFEVDDMQGTLQRLLAAGATQEGEISTTPAGDQLVFLRDPWGVALQLCKRQQPFA